MTVALFNPTTVRLLDYLDYQKLGYEEVHASLHAFEHGVFVDADFSISNLLFFPFHSWIDALLEFRLRRDQDQHQDVSNYLD